MPDYQGNSKKDRGGIPSDRPPKTVERVIATEVIVPKKGLGRKFHDIFIEADVRTVVKYVTMYVFIPAAKNMMMDALYKGGGYLFYGDRGARDRSSGPRMIYNSSPLNRQYPPDIPSRESVMRYAPAVSHDPRVTKYNRSEFLLSTKEEAEVVLENMTNIIETYEIVSVSDLNELVGLPTSPIDNKWGWTKLSNVQIKQVREGYVIEFPPAEPIG